METWKTLRSRAETAGIVSETALEILRVTTARARHEARVAATLRAAMDYVGITGPLRAALDEYLVERRAVRRDALDDTVDVDGAVAILATLLALDDHGVGGWRGRRGSMRGHSRRMLWASGLGSGRWCSGDGDAYAAAMAEARRRVLELVPPTGVDALQIAAALAAYDADHLAYADSEWSYEYARAAAAAALEEWTTATDRGEAAEATAAANAAQAWATAADTIRLEARRGAARCIIHGAGGSGALGLGDHAAQAEQARQFALDLAWAGVVVDDADVEASPIETALTCADAIAELEPAMVREVHARCIEASDADAAAAVARWYRARYFRDI